MVRLAGHASSRAALTRQVRAANGRVLLRRRYALEAGPGNVKPTPGATTSTPPPVAPPSQASIPPPRIKKRRFGFFTRVAFWGTALTATFYAGATYAAMKNDRWHDFFVESVPLGEIIMDYFDDMELQAAAAHIRSEVIRAATSGDYRKDTTPSTPAVDPPATGRPPERAAIEIKDQRPTPEEDLNRRAAQLKERAERKLLALSESTGTDVEELKRQAQAEIDRLSETYGSLTTGRPSSGGLMGRASSMAARATSMLYRHPKFSDPTIENLVKEAEAALRGTPQHAEKPASSPGDAPKDKGARPPSPPAPPPPVADNIYTGRLPLGFELPPGYRLPGKDEPKVLPKPSAKPASGPFVPTEPPSGPQSPPSAPASEQPRQPEAPPAPQPLPLVSSLIAADLKASEPVIAQLASTIDALSAQLSATSNPTAIASARDVIDTAKIDLEQLADRMEHVKEEERKELSKKLEATREEWEGKLRTLEKEAQEQLDSQEDNWKHAFEEEKQKVISGYKEKLQAELTTQSELINQRLKEEVIAQGIELQRRWIRDIKVRVEQERGARLAKLENLSSSLKQIERLTLDNSAYLDENLRLHALWSALRALHTAIDAPVRRPFRDELRVLRNLAAAKEDPVIIATLDSLEASDVPDVGVEPYTDLASWFTTTVYPRVVGVALVPDENAGVLEHLASSLLSNFRFKRQGLVEGSDVLSTLARAEYYVSEKDLDRAARELNQLKGTAKLLLTDWLEAARKRLEVEQALEVVNTQATLASLLVV